MKGSTLYKARIAMAALLAGAMYGCGPIQEKEEEIKKPNVAQVAKGDYTNKVTQSGTYSNGNVSVSINDSGGLETITGDSVGGGLEGMTQNSDVQTNTSTRRLRNTYSRNSLGSNDDVTTTSSSTQFIYEITLIKTNSPSSYEWQLKIQNQSTGADIDDSGINVTAYTGNASNFTYSGGTIGDWWQDDSSDTNKFKSRAQITFGYIDSPGHDPNADELFVNFDSPYNTLASSKIEIDLANLVDTYTITDAMLPGPVQQEIPKPLITGIDVGNDISIYATNTVDGVEYTLQDSENLRDWNDATNITANASSLTVTINYEKRNGFFRLHVKENN